MVKQAYISNELQTDNIMPFNCNLTVLTKQVLLQWITTAQTSSWPVECRIREGWFAEGFSLSRTESTQEGFKEGGHRHGTPLVGGGGLFASEKDHAHVRA